MNEIAAIETRYKGYRFRSRLEARWAVFLDVMEAAWEYEKEGFLLSDGTYYLPDFWLPELHLWLEVKGQYPSEAEFKRCRMLQDQTQAGVLIFHGLPGVYYGTLFCWDLGDSSGGSSEWEVCLGNDGYDGRLCLSVETYKELYADICFDHLIELNNACVKVDIAADAARAARFEYGECGI